MTITDWRRSIILLALPAMMLGACKKKETTTTTTTTAVQLGSESYVVVGTGVLESGPVISGTLVPRNQAVVRAQLSGSVLRTYVDQGQYVRAGQVIAQLDDRALNDAVTSAQLAITNAQSALDVNRREESRLETLVKAGAVAQRDVDQARKNTVASEAALSSARAQLSSAEKQLANTSVRAPFSGMVSEKSANMGDVVQPGTALYTIVEPSTLELQGTIPADALALVHVGLPVKFNVTGYPNQQFTGTITRINPTADPMTRQVRLYAEIPNIGQALVGGLYAEGRIGSTLKTTITLPSDAIDHRMITPAVDRIHNGVVERVPVTLGTVDERSNQVQILVGINPGDTVLRGSALQIALGTHIKPIPSPSTSATLPATNGSGSASTGITTPPSGATGTNSGAPTGQGAGSVNSTNGPSNTTPR